MKSSTTEKQNKDSIADIMWVEKYRPKTLQQIVNQKDIVNALSNLIKKPNEMPHLLFSGSAGIGKTTTALCIAKELLGEDWKGETLELNASDERGIKMVRERVKEFAAVMKLTMEASEKKEKPFRIIILDEADEMTTEAQTALRRIIEDSSKTTRFIIICNYLSQIIDPIQSRCAVFRFKKLSNEDIAKHLKEICKNEKIDYEDGAISQICDASLGDLRHSINLLQTAAGMGKVSIKNVEAAMGISGRNRVSEIIKLGLSGKFNEAREKLLELIYVYGVSETDFMKYAFQETFNNFKLEKPEELASLMAEYDYRLTEGAHPEIQLSAFLAQLGKIGIKDKR